MEKLWWNDFKFQIFWHDLEYVNPRSQHKNLSILRIFYKAIKLQARKNSSLGWLFSNLTMILKQDENFRQ